MTIRTKLYAMTVGLIGAVVLAVTVSVTSVQRSAIQDQSRRRLAGMTDGVARIAQESIKNRDRLMLLSYLMYLQKEHEELAFAAVTISGHTSTIGADRPGLVYWKSEADAVSLKLGFNAAILDAEISTALKPLTRRTAIIAAFFMLLGCAGALSLSKRIIAPLSKLSSAMAAVKAGNFDVMIPAPGGDEVGVLAKRFNEMTAYLKELTQFREDLLHTLTHELNVPLGGLKGYLELWAEGKIAAAGPERDEVVQTMTAAVLRMEQSLGNTLGLFRADAKRAPKRSILLNDLLREACSLFTPEADAKKIKVVMPVDNVLACVHADPELLRRIVANLVSNAVKYASEGGSVRLGVDNGKDKVILRVQDDGCGIPADDLPHLFTKFYRAGTDAGKKRVKGTGLGLSIAQKAAQTLGGAITVSSEVGRGTIFTVTLPKFAPITEAA